MSAEDLYMDDSFRKAAGEIKLSYNKSFWKDAEKHLDDSSLDAAFQNAASVSAFMPEMNIADTVSDAFMDEAFKSAAQTVQVDFTSAHWNQFSTDRSEIEQNVSFADAANSVIADYHAAFWMDADQALQNEGLHYEYRSSYWNDAKVLLDKSDRSVFFKRWSAVAALLLLFSVGGIYSTLNNESDETSVNENSNNAQIENTDIILPVENSNHTIGKEDFLVDSDQSQVQTTAQLNENQNSSEIVSATQNNSEIESEVSGVDLNEINSDVVLSTELSAENSTENTNSFEHLSEQVIENNSENNENLTVVHSDQNSEAENQNMSDTETEANVEQSAINLNEEVVLISSENQESINSDNSINNEINVEMDESLIRLPGADIASNHSVLVAYNGPKIEITRFRLKPTHTLSFYGHAGVGNKYNASEFTPTFRTNFGLEYRRSGFGKMRNFEFGAIAGFNHVRQRDFGTERRVSVFTLDGGTDKLWYKLQLKDMIYANLSGLMSYNISSKHKLNFSAGLDYLVFVQSNMSYKTNSEEGIKTVNNNWGVKDGLNKLDLRIGIGYEFALTKNIALSANGSFGFFDRSENNFMDSNIFDQELSVTAGIKYTFLRKL
jgi:hypothetical protein